ncbi:hypothetical protein E2C01_057649 [Portunus trituberculatus]|uniref:Uncharacterized protein n=1 Tax=Portunus trituberculatus TaxID=210409 RepID=A0A5B7GU39_PORTR|nr:hypothetical protein [Portunus trituberculatus]
MITVSVSETHLYVEAYIPHSFSQPKASKSWFNTACSRAIHGRQVAHKRDDQHFRRSTGHTRTPQNA